MKPRTSFCAALLCCVALVASVGRSQSVDPAIPHLEKRGLATQLIVDGKPFLVLGAEPPTSAPSNLEYLRYMMQVHGRHAPEHRRDCRGVELDRARERQVRLPDRGCGDRGRQADRPAHRPGVVRKLEKRRLQLRARLGEGRPGSLPARTNRGRQKPPRPSPPSARTTGKRMPARLRP